MTPSAFLARQRRTIAELERLISRAGRRDDDMTAEALSEPYFAAVAERDALEQVRRAGR